MGNRIGVILHSNFDEVSPLLYSHYGANSIPFQLQKYLREYKLNYNMNENDGHLYNPSHMMLEFVQSLDRDVHMRIENLTYDNLVYIQNYHSYTNCFDGGCLLVNVTRNNFGMTECDDSAFTLQNYNIVTDELESWKDH